MSGGILVEKISMSGLCDKLIDVITLSALSHFKNKPLIIQKQVFNQADYSKNFSNSRYQDILVDNLIEFFTYPYNINFVDSVSEHSEKFTEYLGGCYPIIDFYYKWCKDICSLDEYLNYFKSKVFSFILPNTHKEHNIDKSFIGLHLRRTDKVSNNPDYGQINISELDDYNTNTIKACLDCITRGYNNFYICGDDKDVCNWYVDFLKKNNCNVIYEPKMDYKDTYIDIHYLSKCYAIIMSCKHSNLSLFSSIIGNNKLITVFDDLYNSMLYKVQWISFIDCINYKNILTSSIGILGHQGVADFFSQNGLFNFIASSYLDCSTKILVESESMITLVKSLFPNFIVELAKVTSEGYNGIESCLICHTPCNSNGVCARDSSKKSKFLDKYEDVKIIKLNCFNNSLNWEQFRANKPFNISFYEYQNIPSYILVTRFILPEIKQINYQKDLSNYIVIHDDDKRNICINRGLLPVDFPIINLNGISSNMIDTVNTIVNSSEIHFIDSNYSVMIWCIQHKYKLIKNKCFLHNSSRPGRDISIYTHNLPSNWYIV